MKKTDAFKKILVTGANGFLGKHVAAFFHQKGYAVYGICRGDFFPDDCQKYGFSVLQTSLITVDTLKQFKVSFDCIVHCAGGSSVAKSIEDPLTDFNNTVAVTMEILEFIRRYSPGTKLIYPSSASVYGEHDASKITINDPLNPVSPYGMHKKVTEELCLFYQRQFNIDISIIRFFSIYGPGLKKQLIWDACKKILSASDELIFWGTGSETRDWLFIDDAVSLIEVCASHPVAPPVINGGSGSSASIKQTLDMLATILCVDKTISFNGAVKAGDPRHYHADMKEASSLGWKPVVSLDAGLEKYVSWFKSLDND